MSQQTRMEILNHIIPTMILFENGKNVAIKTGVLSKDTIKEWINSSVKI